MSVKTNIGKPKGYGGNKIIFFVALRGDKNNSSNDHSITFATKYHIP